MTARTITVDFSKIQDLRQHKSGKQHDRLPTGDRPMTADGKVLSRKQIRARARRRMKRAELMSDQEIAHYYQKPLDEWDTEELAKGRPRNSRGTFSGPKPKWITAEVHEQSMERFTNIVKSDMRVTTVTALKFLTTMIENEEVDDKGKPVVPASTKLDAAKFLIEHVIGKPKQRIESDVSIKLQGILASVMGNPAETLMGAPQGGQGYTLGHLPGVTMPLGTRDEDVVDAELLEYTGGVGYGE